MFGLAVFLEDAYRKRKEEKRRKEERRKGKGEQGEEKN